MECHEVEVSVVILRVLFRAFFKLTVVEYFADVLDDESFCWDVSVSADTESFDYCVEYAAIGIIVALKLLIVTRFWKIKNFKNVDFKLFFNSPPQRHFTPHSM
jgi:hypothetical protein